MRARLASLARSAVEKTLGAVIVLAVVMAAAVLIPSYLLFVLFAAGVGAAALLARAIWRTPNYYGEDPEPAPTASPVVATQHVVTRPALEGRTAPPVLPAAPQRRELER